MSEPSSLRGIYHPPCLFNGGSAVPRPTAQSDGQEQQRAIESEEKKGNAHEWGRGPNGMLGRLPQGELRWPPSDRKAVYLAGCVAMRIATKRCESLGAWPEWLLGGTTARTLAQPRKAFNSRREHFLPVFWAVPLSGAQSGRGADRLDRSSAPGAVALRLFGKGSTPSMSYFPWSTIRWYLPNSFCPSVNMTSIRSRYGVV